MKRRFGFSTLLAASVITAVVSAQHRPDFSGQWALVSDKNAPPNTSAMGQDLAITQDATTLRIERQLVNIRSRTSGRSTASAAGPSSVVYNLNGPETRHVSQSASPGPRPASQTTGTGGVEESTSTATWAGEQLVLVTVSTLKFTQPNREPAVTRVRQTLRNVLSLGPDGTLVVEHLITVDPPASTSGDTRPEPIRSVYRKTPR